MSLFAPRTEVRTNEQGKLQDLLALRGGYRSASLTVTPDTAMRHSVVNECVQMIANLAMLDVHAVREENGIQVRAAQDPVLLREPSAELDPMEWRRQVYVSWLTRGTAFGMVAQTDRYEYPTQIELLPAECVSLRQQTPGPLNPWTWFVEGREVQRWPRGPLWVARGLHTKPGVPVGISPIEMALASIGLGLVAEDFGASWFYDGAHPSSILTTDQQVTQEQAEKIKRRFRAIYERGNREPAVLGAGMQYQQVQVAANESQFLDTIDKNAVTVARFFLVPPNEVGAQESGGLTYNNAESRVLQLLARCFQPWLSRFEMTMTRVTQRPFTILADIDGLARTDIRTRTEVDASDVNAGIRNPNEVRRTRNLPPFAEGDRFAWPPKQNPPKKETP